MPRIKDLKRFLKHHDSFKIIHKEYYEKRHYSRAYEVRVYSNDKVEVSIFHGWEKWDEKEFNSLDEAIEWIQKEFPPEFYVYYYPRFREPDYNYTNVRHLFGFTVDEAYAWKTILARAMGHLNGRMLLGFRKVSIGTSKKCDKCRERKAAIMLVFDYHGKRYGVYYCSECFLEAINKAIKRLHRKLEGMYEIMSRLTKVDRIDEVYEYA